MRRNLRDSHNNFRQKFVDGVGSEISGNSRDKNTLEYFTILMSPVNSPLFKAHKVTQFCRSHTCKEKEKMGTKAEIQSLHESGR